MKVDIVIAGVGGQGTMLAARVLGRAACRAGINAIGAELLGLSQRGGSVVSHVRIGDDTYSPVIMEGAADVLLGFEPSEAVRRLPYIAKNGTIIINTNPYIPPSVSMGFAKYPDLNQIFKVLEEHGRLLTLDASRLAAEAGNPITLNSVMLGALAATGKLPFNVEILEESLAMSVAKPLVEPNVKALRLGYNECLNQIAKDK